MLANQVLGYWVLFVYFSDWVRNGVTTYCRYCNIIVLIIYKQVSLDAQKILVYTNFVDAANLKNYGIGTGFAQNLVVAGVVEVIIALVWWRSCRMLPWNWWWLWWSCWWPWSCWRWWAGAAGSKLGPDLGRLSAFPTLVTHSTPQTQSDCFAVLPDDDALPSVIMMSTSYVGRKK